MEITQHPGADSLELRCKGRLDAAWAEHVGNTIEEAVRAGSHRILLNFAGVVYISSLGIRVLVTHYRRLKSVSGSLTIVQPSEITHAILKSAGLADLLMADATASVTAGAAQSAGRITRGNGHFELFPQPVLKPLSCSVVGRPALLASAGYAAADCRAVKFAGGSFGLGLGAFGEGFDDCKNRFGEFMAAGGCAITLPTTDAHALPDYVVEQGGLVPKLETLYAAVGAGDFSTMVRFDAPPDGPQKIGLSELVDALIEISAAEMAAFVVLAETAGLVGATLRRSPASGPVSMSVPGVRDWLSFTTERASERSLSLLVGVAGRNVPECAAPFLRPMKAGSPVQAHIHAAQFPYRPVQRGAIPFAGTIADVLASSTPSTVLHLMADSRPFEGVGETDLVRGACWVGPLATISPG